MQQENFSQVDPAKLQAQKEYKQMKELFKAVIQIAVDNQKDFRKEMSKPGQSIAQSMHAINGFDLRCMYIAYALFRNFYGGYTKFPEPKMEVDVDNKIVTGITAPEGSRPVSEKYINDLIQKYVPKTVYTG